MRALRHSQIKEYFFGRAGDETLAPSSQTADFSDLHIFRIAEDSDEATDDYGQPRAPRLFDKVVPDEGMVGMLLAITTAGANEAMAVIRDSSIRGYVYVADVDEAKKKVRLLSPLPGQTPASALVLGSWPEKVEGLVG